MSGNVGCALGGVARLGDLSLHGFTEPANQDNAYRRRNMRNAVYDQLPLLPSEADGEDKDLEAGEATSVSGCEFPICHLRSGTV